MPPPRVQFATTADGVRIAYTVTGEGPPLFWLPHFLASHVQLEWEFPQKFVYTRLAEQFTVVRFDCRGLGLSDRDVEDISLEARMRDLEAVARKIEAARFAVVGIEGGGNLATAYAVAHPERVSHLVLINWSPRFRDEASGARLSALGLLVRQDWEMLAQNIGGVAFGYDAPAAAGYARLVRASVHQPMASATANWWKTRTSCRASPGGGRDARAPFRRELVRLRSLSPDRGGQHPQRLLPHLRGRAPAAHLPADRRDQGLHPCIPGPATEAARASPGAAPRGGITDRPRTRDPGAGRPRSEHPRNGRPAGVEPAHHRAAPGEPLPQDRRAKPGRSHGLRLQREGWWSNPADRLRPRGEAAGNPPLRGRWFPASIRGRGRPPRWPSPPAFRSGDPACRG